MSVDLFAYPPAPRHIVTTDSVLGNWRGPCLQGTIVGRARSGAVRVYSGSSVEEWLPEQVRLDPAIPEVRDLLVRGLGLPTWMRDGALPPWASAGLVACAAAGKRPLTLYQQTTAPGLGGFLFSSEPRGTRWIPAGDAPEVFRYLMQGPEDVLHEVALVPDAETLVLPWPGGPRAWRREQPAATLPPHALLQGVFNRTGPYRIPEIP